MPRIFAAAIVVVMFFFANQAQAACTIINVWQTGKTWLAECSDESKVFCTKSTMVNGQFALDPDDPSACTPIGPQAAAQPAASSGPDPDPNVAISFAAPANMVGTVMAYRPNVAMARCSQCVELRTFGKAVLIKVDSEPVPVIYGHGRVRLVTVDHGNGRAALDSAAISTDGNLFIMGSMAGSTVSWDVLEEDQARPGVFVPQECRHVHTHPERRDHPLVVSVGAGEQCDR